MAIRNSGLELTAKHPALKHLVSKQLFENDPGNSGNSDCADCGFSPRHPALESHECNSVYRYCRNKSDDSNEADKARYPQRRDDTAAGRSIRFGGRAVQWLAG